MIDRVVGRLPSVAPLSVMVTLHYSFSSHNANLIYARCTRCEWNNAISLWAFDIILDLYNCHQCTFAKTSSDSEPMISIRVICYHLQCTPPDDTPVGFDPTPAQDVHWRCTIVYRFSDVIYIAIWIPFLQNPSLSYSSLHTSGTIPISLSICLPIRACT